MLVIILVLFNTIPEESAASFPVYAIIKLD